LFLLAGIAAALYHREKTGVGRFVDVAMLDGQLAILESAIMRYAATGQVPGRLGNRHPSITPFAVYAAADRPLVLAAGNEPPFGRLGAALAGADLAADPRYSSNPARTRHAEELKADLEAALCRRPAGHWIEMLEAAGVPCALMQNVAEAVAHPQTHARNMIVRAGALVMAGNPLQGAGFPGARARRAPARLDAPGGRARPAP